MSVGGDQVFSVHASTIDKVVGLFTSTVKPVVSFVADVAGNGWLGFSIVFVIFFSIFLLKTGGLSKNNEGYARGLVYIGTRGFLIFVIYGALIFFDYALTPAFYLIGSGFIHTVSGGHPSFGDLFGLLAHSGYSDDLKAFYSSDDRLLLPLGIHPTFLICVAFGTMYLIGRALSKMPSND